MNIYLLFIVWCETWEKNRISMDWKILEVWWVVMPLKIVIHFHNADLANLRIVKIKNLTINE
jgi:hypothetical protein